MRNEQTTGGFHFEEFKRIPRSTEGGMCVSIYMPAGYLCLNARAVAALGLAERVILLFDRHKMVMGVKPTCNPVPHSIRVRNFRGKQHRITISEFLEENDIRLSYSIRFLEPYVEDDGTLILDLNRTTRVKGSRTIAKQRAEAKR